MFEKMQRARSGNRLLLGRVLFFTCCIGVLFLALAPVEFAAGRIEEHFSDKVQHFVAFAYLGCLAVLGWGSSNAIVAIAGLSLFGGFVELLQGLPIVNRDCDIADWWTDNAAIFLSIAVSSLLQGRHSSSNDIRFIDGP